MEPRNALWDRVRHPRGPVGRAARRAGLSAVGTYAAYLVHGLRHPGLLRPTVTAEERADRLPGDDIVRDPDWVTNFGIDIAVPPGRVFPWIVQIGYGRAGWYTWFPLDNGGVPSAETIVPALQALVVGDAIPDGPRAAEGFGVWRVRALEAPRSLVLHSRRNPFNGREVPAGEDGSAFIDVTWVFALAQTSHGTRLRVRVRAKLAGGMWVAPAAHAARLLFGLGDNVMENSMLEGIRERSERQAS
jgi:hypothetical protein